MTTLIDDTDREDPSGQSDLASKVGRLCQRALTDAAYTLSAFPIALAAFVLTVVLLSSGLGLSIVVAGVFVLAAAVRSARWFAELERRRLRSLLSRTSPTPRYRSAGDQDRLWSRATTPLLDPQSWRDVAWALFGVLSATAAAVVTITWSAAALDGLTYWFWQFFVSERSNAVSLASAIGLAQGRLEESVVNFMLGAVALISLPFVIRGAAAAHATAASALLDGSSARGR